MPIEIFSVNNTTALPIPYIEDGVQAGFPSPAQEYISESIDLNKMPLLNTCSLAYEYCKVAQKVSSGDVKEY